MPSHEAVPRTIVVRPGRVRRLLLVYQWHPPSPSDRSSWRLRGNLIAVLGGPGGLRHVSQCGVPFLLAERGCALDGRELALSGWDFLIGSRTCTKEL